MIEGRTKMTELEKIAYARTFLDKLANGVNPLDDTPVPEGDLVNHVRLSRCFFYVSDLLRRVIENGGIGPKPTKRRSKPFFLDEERRALLQTSETPCSVQEIAAEVNGVIDGEQMRPLSPKQISKWLLNMGFVEYLAASNGKRYKMPTEQGREIGITAEERMGYYGTYYALSFDRSAQQFIFDNLEAIVGSDARTATLRGSLWTEEQDRTLTELFEKGMRIEEIAKEMKRTKGGVFRRLKEKGLLPDGPERPGNE